MSVAILGHRIESSSMGPPLIEIEKKEFDRASWENQIASSYELRKDCENLSVDFSQRKVVMLRCTLGPECLLALSNFEPSGFDQRTLLIRIVRACFALPQFLPGNHYLVSLLLSVANDRHVYIVPGTNDERVDEFASKVDAAEATVDEDEYYSLIGELRHLQTELKQELCGPCLNK